MNCVVGFKSELCRKSIQNLEQVFQLFEIAQIFLIFGLKFFFTDKIEISKNLCCAVKFSDNGTTNAGFFRFRSGNGRRRADFFINYVISYDS